MIETFWIAAGAAARRGGIALILAAALLGGCASKPGSTSIFKKSKGDPSPEKTEFPEVTEEQLQSFAHYATGLSLDMRDDAAGALAEYEKAAAGNPSEENLALDVARRLLRNKQNDRAIELLSKISKDPKSTGTVDAWLGVAYAAAGDTNKAIAANRLSIQKTPTQIAAYANLGELYLQLKKTNEVISVLNDAGKQTKAAADFYVNFAEILLRMETRDVITRDDAKKRSVAALDRAVREKPEDLLLRQRIGEAYLFHGEAEKAQAIFEKLYADKPQIPGLREKLINIYFRTDKAKASVMLNELLREAPTDPRPHIFLGELAIEDNRMAEGLERFETARKLAPQDESLWYRVAALRITMKRPGEALVLLDEARARFGKLNFAQEFYRGIALAAMEKYSDALSRFTSAEMIARTLEPDRLTPQLYFQLGAAAERAKNIEQAVGYFRKSLELDPDLVEAFNYLGYMWAERGENLNEAHDLIEKALKADPRNAAYLDSMAWVLFKQNKPAEALPYMKKAIELTPEPDATLLDHLGDILAAMKKPAEARDAWQKALKLEPKDEIRKKLEAGT